MENLYQKDGLVLRTSSKKSLIMASTFGSKSKFFMTMSIPPQDEPLTNRPVAEPVKAIALPQDVPSTSDRRLIEFENQVQRLMEAHLAPTQPTQVNKITTSCEICSGPHDTQYCMEDPEQAFVEYASSRTDVAGGALPSDTFFTPNEDPQCPAHTHGSYQHYRDTSPSNKMTLGWHGELFAYIDVDLPMNSCPWPIIITLIKKEGMSISGRNDLPRIRIGMGHARKFLIKNEEEIFTDAGDGVRIYPDGVASPAIKTYDYIITLILSLLLSLYLMRRSLEVLRKFHWIILGGRFNQLSHVSSPLLSKRWEYKAHLLKDKQIPSVEVFSTWMTFGGNIRNLGSFGEETYEITDLHQILKEVLLIEHGDGVASIKQCRRDLFSDSVWNLETASGRVRLKENLESST
ncbi:hypothetical protein Tco_0572483 [Tanacetum coccineum]